MSTSVAGIFAFGLAGLGCSALLPLTISFAEENLVAISAATAGLVIAAYQLGYGGLTAAFSLGGRPENDLTRRFLVELRRRGGSVRAF